MWYEKLIDQNIVPDFLLRMGVRQLLSHRLASLPQNKSLSQQQKMDLVSQLKSKAIAEHTDKANEQHYQVPSEFLKLCLGKNMKYSCCLFPKGYFFIIQGLKLWMRQKRKCWKHIVYMLNWRMGWRYWI